MRVLLLGNGVNRISKDYSWENLLEDLIKEVRKGDVIKFIKEKPFTLLYEEIVLRTMRFQNKQEIDLKRIITGLVKKIKYNEFHKKFLDIGVEHILTTNYDYNFENAYNKTNCEEKNIRTETKYNMFRRGKCRNKYIWHIHGEAEVPNSLTLGHEHYVGYVQKMRNYLTIGIPIRKGKISSPFFSSKSKSSMNTINEHNIISWVDLFLLHDIHIIGLSYDYTEIDLWWLTIYKERLKNEYHDIGKTVFHYFEAV